ncbi:MAG TPA: ATPase, T2SS/T4P/T4SS family [Balneolales bacterium]|nr:ATPase, T2SS/T4P/T4SS family [Balneolales bacterium]
MSKVDTRRHIGDILQQRGIISNSELEQALEIQDNEVDSSPRRLGQILHGDLGLDRHRVMQAISDVFAFREISFNGHGFTENKIKEIRDLIGSLPKQVVDELIGHYAIPFEIQNNIIVIASSDPTDPSLPDLASRLAFQQYEITYCRLELLEELIEHVHSTKNEFLDILDEIEYEETEVDEEKDEVTEEEIDAEINQSLLNSLVEGMLVEAVHQGASDIHIIPAGPTSSNIYFRVDGKLQIWYTQKKVKPEAIAAVIKDKTRNVDRFERESSQDGFIQRIIDHNNIRYRVSIMPIVAKEFDRKFESIVIRVLDDRKVITDLNKLGLQKKAHDDFKKAINKPSGIVIITGPTGSGKSTTLIAALYSVIDLTKNVLTVEEPVEYIIKGARQLKISHHMTFDQSMRGILRHDPDIVLVGEIRDLKTAEIAIKLANTGHLTFSTLHTNDAPSAVSRLYKMGVEPFLIANSVNLVMAQRLVRKLCDHCKEEITDLNPEIPRNLGFTNEEIRNTTFYRPVGCSKCNQGYKGRIAIMEALYFTKEIRNMILSSGNNVDEEMIREQAIKDGMLSLRASGRERIKEGITSIDEVMAVTVDDA